MVPKQRLIWSQISAEPGLENPALNGHWSEVEGLNLDSMLESPGGL